MPIRITGGEFRGRLLAVPEKGVRPTQDKVRAAVFSSLQSVIPDARVLDLFAGTGAFGLEALSRGAAFACFVEADSRTLACLKGNVERLLGNPTDKSECRWRIVNSDVESFLAGNPIQTNQPQQSFRNPPCPDRETRRATPPREGSLDQNPLLASAKPGRGGVRDQASPERFAQAGAGGGSAYDIVFADPPYEADGERLKKILFHLAKKPILKKDGYFIAESSAKSPLLEADGWKIEWNRIYGETRICIYRVERFNVQRSGVGNHES